MKKTLIFLTILGLASSVQAKVVSQTICFSQEDTGQKIGANKFYMASLGEEVTLNGGKCKGASLIEMNKKGWKLIQVVVGLNQSFGMVLEK